LPRGVGNAEDVIGQRWIAEIDRQHLTANRPEVRDDPGGRAVDRSGAGPGGQHDTVGFADGPVGGDDGLDSVADSDFVDLRSLDQPPPLPAESLDEGSDQSEGIDLVVGGAVDGTVDRGGEPRLEFPGAVGGDPIGVEPEFAAAGVEVFQRAGMVSFEPDDDRPFRAVVELDARVGFEPLDECGVALEALELQFQKVGLLEIELGRGGEHPRCGGAGTAAGSVALEDRDLDSAPSDLPAEAEADRAGADDGDLRRFCVPRGHGYPTGIRFQDEARRGCPAGPDCDAGAPICRTDATGLDPCRSAPSRIPAGCTLFAADEGSAGWPESSRVEARCRPVARRSAAAESGSLDVPSTRARD